MATGPGNRGNWGDGERVRDENTPPLGVPDESGARADASALARRARHRTRVGLSAMLLLPYVLIVLLMTMSAVPLDRGYGTVIRGMLRTLHHHGVPAWVGYTQLEFTANVIMFLPLGLLLGLALPRRMTWLALLLMPAFSAVIELTQAVALSERFATIQDVVANSIGGWVGVMLALIIVAARRSRVRARARS